MVADKLSNSSVGIAGLGGLGSNVAMALARAGVGHLVLVDFDVVERKNLNRQAYTVSQVGMRKTEALALNITSANPDVRIDIHDVELSKGGMEGPFTDVDVVVEALDSAETKATFIEEILLKLPDKPLVAASGVAGYGNSDRVRTLRTGNLYLVNDDEAPSSEDDVLLAPRVGLFAYWQANTVLEILLGDGDGN
jgi:sulfur carrier protein ThiS adenylyltransferase